MRQGDIKSSYDVVIIGAGVGGLTAAALLGKAGYSVCVLEKEPHAGGYLAGFRRKDFRFDTAIHWLNQYNPGGMVCRVFDMLGDDYPRAVPQERIRRYKGKGFDYLLTSDPEQLKAQWISEFPEDRDGIIRFFNAARRLGRAFHHFGNIFRSEETMNLAERMMNKKRLLQFAMPFIPFLRYTGEEGMRKGLARFFTNPGLLRVFGSEAELLSCLVPIGWAYYGDYQSPPKGGGQMIPEWLTHMISYYGGDMHFRCTVGRILVEDGLAAGVELNHRGSLHTIRSRYVIAACDTETLYEHMLPAGIPTGKIRAKLKDAVLYSSSVTVSVALDCPAEQLGFNEELVHLYGSGRHAGGAGICDPEHSEISILAPSVRDKSLAPAGCGTLTLFMPAHMEAFDCWHTETDPSGRPVRGEAYRKLKEQIAETLIRRVAEEVAPGLKEHILFYDTATPVTHWRYTGNKNGTMMGARPGRKNMQSKVASYRTPVPNLLISGHWAELGGGVPIAVKAAANTCLLIFKKENTDLFRRMTGYMKGSDSLQVLREAFPGAVYRDSWKPRPTPAERLLARTRERGSGDSEG